MSQCNAYNICKSSSLWFTCCSKSSKICQTETFLFFILQLWMLSSWLWIRTMKKKITWTSRNALNYCHEIHKAIISFKDDDKIHCPWNTMQLWDMTEDQAIKRKSESEWKSSLNNVVVKLTVFSKTIFCSDSNIHFFLLYVSWLKSSKNRTFLIEDFCILSKLNRIWILKKSWSFRSMQTFKWEKPIMQCGVKRIFFNMNNRFDCSKNQMRLFSKNMQNILYAEKDDDFSWDDWESKQLISSHFLIINSFCRVNDILNANDKNQKNEARENIKIFLMLSKC